MWRERTPSCFLQRKTRGRSQPFRAPQLRSQQAAELGLPASLTTTILPARKAANTAGLQFSHWAPASALGNVAPASPAGAARPWGILWELPHGGLRAVSRQARSVPGAARPSLGMAGLPHLPEPRQPRHPAPAAAPGAVNLREQEASHTTRRFPAAGQPRRLWHSPLPQPKGASISGASLARRKSQDFPAWMAGAQWSGMGCLARPTGWLQSGGASPRGGLGASSLPCKQRNVCPQPAPRG